MEANFSLLREDNSRNFTPTERCEASAGQKSHVSEDSVIGREVKLGDRTSVTKSVIGSHCTIGSGVKISNAVIMGHVIIED
jgi:translation initiation factor eIF-2B subunit gamma